jgi:hypothetical protein
LQIHEHIAELWHTTAREQLAFYGIYAACVMDSPLSPVESGRELAQMDCCGSGWLDRRYSRHVSCALDVDGDLFP